MSNTPGLQLRRVPREGVWEGDEPGHYVMWLGNQAQIIAHRCYDGEKHDYAHMLGGMTLVRCDPDFGRYSVELFYEADPKPPRDDALTKERRDRTLDALSEGTGIPRHMFTGERPGNIEHDDAPPQIGYSDE